ncbi:uncharacterized protein LOC117785978 [Drosophila innubila]|uniref:uncharacterized protein LOC117785978 n=1 Tax=Drosophila innubila TaxID=198719 RepID=UPI00148D728C|nr:uncharacterized protein LOC117785978 [Drosophila innubila]
MIRKTLLHLFPVLLLLCFGCDGKRSWDYEPISVDSTSSDSNKLDIDIRVKRMPRGEFAYDGYIKYNYDITEDTMIEAEAFRSNSGRDEDYTPMPWTIPKQPFSKFIDDFYKDMIYENFHSCSNMPAPDDGIPYKIGNWTFNECVVEGKGMPEMAPQGYLKVIFKITGEVEWGFVSVSRIFDKYMP